MKWVLSNITPDYRRLKTREKFNRDPTTAKISLSVLQQRNDTTGWYLRKLVLSVLCRKEKHYILATGKTITGKLLV